jgi:hypothetical protein
MVCACVRARVRAPAPSCPLTLALAPKVDGMVRRLPPGRPGQSYLFTGEPLQCMGGMLLRWRVGGSSCKQCKRSADAADAGRPCEHCTGGSVTKAGATGGYTPFVKHEGS